MEESSKKDFNTGAPVSNRGLNSPISDMKKYLSFLLGEAKYNFILKRESLEEMWQPFYRVDNITNVGLTFFITKNGNDNYPGHTGSKKILFHFF